MVCSYPEKTKLPSINITKRFFVVWETESNPMKFCVKGSQLTYRCDNVIVANLIMKQKFCEADGKFNFVLGYALLCILPAQITPNKYLP